MEVSMTLQNTPQAVFPDDQRSIGVGPYPSHVMTSAINNSNIAIFKGLEIILIEFVLKRRWKLNIFLYILLLLPFFICYSFREAFLGTHFKTANPHATLPAPQAPAGLCFFFVSKAINTALQMITCSLLTVPSIRMETLWGYKLLCTPNSWEPSILKNLAIFVEWI